MTISSENRKSGPFLGTGAVSEYPFDFTVFVDDDLSVVMADTFGAESTLVLNSDYTVDLNVDQDSTPGGTVVLTNPLADDYLLVITSQLPNLQPTDLTNQGGFYPQVVTRSLDRLTILVQQLKEQIGRAVKVPITAVFDATADALIARIISAESSASADADAAAASAAAAATFDPDLYLLKSGDTMTGALAVPAGASGAQVPQAQEVALLASTQLGGGWRRNVNGDMRIAQTGTSFPAASGHVIDGWLYSSSGASVATVSQQTLSASPTGMDYSLRATITTADASIAAGDFAYLRTICEGYDVADFVGKTFTVGFWVNSAKTGIHCAALKNSGSDRSYVFEYIVNAASTDEFKTHTVVGGLPSGGTWDFTNGSGLYLSCALAAGSTYQTTAGSWNVGNFLATSNQVNVCDTIGNIFEITGVQINPGATATPYEHRPFQQELSICRRQLRPNGILIGWSPTTTAVNGLAVDFSANPMRAVPSVALLTGTNKIHDISVGNRNASAPVLSGGSVNGCYLSVTSTATTSNKAHNLFADAVIFDARLI